MEQPRERPTLATPAEAAEYLRSTPNAMKQMRHRGTGPKYVRSGRRILYAWSDLYAYVNANTVATAGAHAGAA